jgi:AraC-like DNA-binding protein
MDGVITADLGPIPDDLANRLLGAIGNEPFRVGVEDRLRQILDPHGVTLRDDPRLESVLLTLRKSLLTEPAPTRERLAVIAGLSESRFSHWFRERTGMPARGYRKWLRLACAVECVLAGKNLTAAAHEAGFSDQPHFTRAFVEAFGIAPSGVLHRLISD